MVIQKSKVCKCVFESTLFCKTECTCDFDFKHIYDKCSLFEWLSMFNKKNYDGIDYNAYVRLHNIHHDIAKFRQTIEDYVLIYVGFRGFY
jgi:hypothetical protein